MTLMLMTGMHHLLVRLGGLWVIATTSSRGKGSGSGDEFWSRIAVPAIVLGVMILGAVIAVAVARKMLSEKEANDGGFSLHDLKEMHRKGELTDVEYRAARDAVIANMTSDQNE